MQIEGVGNEMQSPVILTQELAAEATDEPSSVAGSAFAAKQRQVD